MKIFFLIILMIVISLSVFARDPFLSMSDEINPDEINPLENLNLVETYDYDQIQCNDIFNKVRCMRIFDCNWNPRFKRCVDRSDRHDRYIYEM
ncbi:MAG: hypothetical protein HQK51_05415 [Oligoflexia bacterium]|nr:hypothetical protein [Oligoflexia bacterium]